MKNLDEELNNNQENLLEKKDIQLTENNKILLKKKVIIKNISCEKNLNIKKIQFNKENSTLNKNYIACNKINKISENKKISLKLKENKNNFQKIETK